VRKISSIKDEALSRARSCILEPQAIEAGVLFGTDLLRAEVDPVRQTEIQTALTDTLPKTAPGSNARAFMTALLATVEAVWGYMQ